MLAKTRTDKDMKIVIIGGNAAGLSMLAQTRRHTEAEIIVLERGAHVGYASCGLPYYVGGTIKERTDLLPLDPAKCTRASVPMCALSTRCSVSIPQSGDSR